MTDHLVFTLERLPSLLAALVLLGLAALLLRMDFETRLHRAFAFLLVLKAFFLGLVAFSDVSPLDLASRIRMYFAIAIPFVAVYFALVFHSHYAPSGRPHAVTRNLWLLWLTVAATGILLLYGLNKNLYYSETGAGPLALFIDGSYTAFAGIAFILGRLALDQEAANRRSALMLAALALCLEPLHQGTVQLLWWVWSFSFGISPFQGILADPILLGLRSIWGLTVGVLVGVAVMFYLRGRTKDGRLRRDVKPFLLAMLLPVATGVLVIGTRVSYQSTLLWLDLHWALDALWMLTAAALIAYAVLYHRFLDSPRRLGRTVRMSTVVGALVLVFFVAKEFLEEILVEQYPLLSGIGAAVVAVALLHPILFVVGRVLRKVMPSVTTGSDLDKDERLGLYRSQVEVVWMDGVVTRKERLLLERMAERLQLTQAQVDRIEKEVVAALVEDGSGKGRLEGPATSS